MSSNTSNFVERYRQKRNEYKLKKSKSINKIKRLDILKPRRTSSFSSNIKQKRKTAEVNKTKEDTNRLKSEIERLDGEVDFCTIQHLEEVLIDSDLIYACNTVLIIQLIIYYDV